MLWPDRGERYVSSMSNSRFARTQPADPVSTTTRSYPVLVLMTALQRHSRQSEIILNSPLKNPTHPSEFPRLTCDVRAMALTLEPDTNGRPRASHAVCS